MKLKFFYLAKKLAEFSNHAEQHLGAVITKGNRLVSVGWNKNQTHPRSKSHFKKLHAELAAIIKARQNLRGCSIYIYRETKNGNMALSFPCPSCYSAIKEAEIKRIFYSDATGYKYQRVI